MSAARWAIVILALFAQAIALTWAIGAYNFWLCAAIGLSDAVLAVVCYEADQ